MDDFDPIIPRCVRTTNTEDDGFVNFVCGGERDDGARYYRRKRGRTEGNGFWASFQRVCEVILALQLSEVIRTFAEVFF